MTDGQTSFFDKFTGSEAERMEVIMAELDGVPWAQGVLERMQHASGLSAVAVWRACAATAAKGKRARFFGGVFEFTA